MTTAESSNRKRLSHGDVPGVSLQQALRIPQALAELGKVPSSPVQVAAAVGIKPSSGPFRTLTGAAIAYGLVTGGYNAARIELTELGRRIVSPTVDGDDAAAMREAVMKPRVVNEFLTRYKGSAWPRENIGRNVLEEMGVPANRTAYALEAIKEDAEAVGFLVPINGDHYVELDCPAAPASVPGEEERDGPAIPLDEDEPDVSDATPVPPLTALPAPPPNLRVFITHGKNTAIVKQIKELLSFGGFEPVVATENHTAAKPVPDKVMDDMRSCAAGIVHVGPEKKVMDPEGGELDMLNPNVLIEIGAAMALYRKRFILLVEKGTTLPSNLQGLYEVRYEGDGLDYEATMKLLKAFSDFRTDGTGRADEAA
jgi:hypothetical protein